MSGKNINVTKKALELIEGRAKPRDLLATRMAIEGVPYVEIGKRLNVRRQRAHQIVTAASKEARVAALEKSIDLLVDFLRDKELLAEADAVLKEVSDLTGTPIE